MFELKPLSENSIPKALVMAKHYRLLNEPWQASSICRDILAIDPDNQKAVMYLILAISDQFDTGKTSGAIEARDLCKQLKKKYEKFYYRGIIEERSGKAALRRKTPRAKYIAYQYYCKAMEYFEKADKIHPEKNEDAILRWNACARRIKEHKLEAAPDEDRVLF